MTVSLVWANWLTIPDGVHGKSTVKPPHSKAPASEGGPYRFKGHRAD